MWQLSYMYAGENICKTTYKYPQFFSKEEEKTEDKNSHLCLVQNVIWDLIRSPQHEILPYFSYMAENREIKAYKLNLQIRTPQTNTWGKNLQHLKCCQVRQNKMTYKPLIFCWG